MFDSLGPDAEETWRPLPEREGLLLKDRSGQSSPATRLPHRPRWAQQEPHGRFDEVYQAGPHLMLVKLGCK